MMIIKTLKKRKPPVTLSDIISGGLFVYGKSLYIKDYDGFAINFRDGKARYISAFPRQDRTKVYLVDKFTLVSK